MPRFLVGITHQVYRHRVFAIAGAITALFLMLLAVLPALFASDPKLSNTVPAYSEVSEEVVDALVHSSSLPLLVAAIIFSIWGVSVYQMCIRDSRYLDRDLADIDEKHLHYQQA